MLSLAAAAPNSASSGGRSAHAPCTWLQKCGVEAVVLEARERVGGRVYTHHGDGFTAPVDLGASIITGTQPSVEKGLRADPSAQVARCVGWGPSV